MLMLMLMMVIVRLMLITVMMMMMMMVMMMMMMMMMMHDLGCVIFALCPVPWQRCCTLISEARSPRPYLVLRNSRSLVGFVMLLS